MRPNDHGTTYDAVQRPHPCLPLRGRCQIPSPSKVRIDHVRSILEEPHDSDRLFFFREKLGFGGIRREDETTISSLPSPLFSQGDGGHNQRSYTFDDEEELPAVECGLGLE